MTATLWAALMSVGDRYERFESLGQNDYLTVYRGWDRVSRRNVAIMELDQRFRANPEQFDEIWDEVLSFAGLDHPGLVPVLTVEKEAAWVVTALMQGNLAGRMAERPLTNQQIRAALQTGLEALGFLHRKGKLHGDVRPQTLLIDEEGNIRLSHPVGLALGGQIPRRKMNQKYLAPELVNSEFGELGPASDLYALGFSIYELLIGKDFDRNLGIEGGTPQSGNLAGINWLRWHASKEPLKPIAQAVPNVPADIADVLSRLTPKRMVDRAKSAEEVLSLLRDDDSHEPAFEAKLASPPSVEAPVSQPSKPSRLSSNQDSTRRGGPSSQQSKRPVSAWEQAANLAQHKYALPVTVALAIPVALLIKAAMSSTDEVGRRDPQPIEPQVVSAKAISDLQKEMKASFESLGKSISAISEKQAKQGAQIKQLETKQPAASDNGQVVADEGWAAELAAVNNRLDHLEAQIVAKNESPVEPDNSSTEPVGAISGTVEEEQLSPDAYAGRAIWRLKAGELEGAIDDIENALKQSTTGPGSYSKAAFDIYLASARRQINSKRYDEAIVECGKALKYADNSELRSIALYHRAAAQSLFENHDAAIADYEAALQEDPTQKQQLAVQLAQEYLARGTQSYGKAKYDAALIDLNKATALDANLIAAWPLLASSESHLQKSDDAIQHFETAFKLSAELTQKWGAEAARCHLTRSDARIQSGDAQGALADLEAAIQLDPASTEGLTKRGTLLTRLQRYDDAIADFSRARNQSTNLNNDWYVGARSAYYERGRARAAQGHHRLAATDFSAVLEIDPLHQDATLARANEFVALDALENALADYERGIELLDQAENGAVPREQLVSAIFGHGTVCLRLQQNERAVRDFSQLISSGIKDPNVFVKRGIALENLGKHETAIADFSQAIAIDENWSVPFNNRGVAYLELGKPSEGASDFSRAIALDESYSDAFYNRHIANYRLGRQDEAAADLQRATELNAPLAVQ